ncbi:putative ribonuclease H-like domain-containing protein [Tanacetum coccineum]
MRGFLEQILEDDRRVGFDSGKLALPEHEGQEGFSKNREECKGTRNQDSRNMNQDSSRRTVNVEETSSKAMLAIDGADSEVHNDKTCSKTCLKSFETLKTQLDDLRIEFNKSEFNLANYKRGLASIEEQLVFYKKNEVIFCEQLAVLKRNISYKDLEISVLKGSQILDKSRKGQGFVSYNAVPPPLTGLFLPPNLDLSYSGLEEFQQPKFEGYGPRPSKSVSEDTSNEIKESPDTPLVEELVSDDKLEKKIVFPTIAKIEFVRAKQQEKPVKYAEMYRLFLPLNLDLSYSGLEEFQQPEFKGYGPKPSKSVSEDTSNEMEFVRPKQQEKPVRKPVKYAEMYRPKAVNTARPNSAVVNAVRENQVNAVKTSRNLIEDMLPLGEELKEAKLLRCVTKKNNVLFTDTTFVVLSLDFKLLDESQVLLKVPRKNNMYSVDMKNIVPKESLTCLVAKATLDESMLWHRRLGHVNFKTINKLVKENLVRGLPSKRFENNQTCVACLKGKQHKASCKSKIQNSITQPLFMLHMDLFGPTFVSSLMNKKYCLVVTDDYSRFTWVFLLASKDETSGILKRLITEIENLVDKKVKIIRCDNGTEFKNRVMSEFCEHKGIKREFSVARTPQQNDVAERRNRTLIEAARTMLADFKLPTTFWAEAVNTACYVQNMFDGKSDEGFFIGYSLNSKAFRVYNIKTRKVEENLHIRFLEDKPIIAGDGPKWLFDIDVLTKSINYVPVVAGTNSNDLVDGSLFDSSSKNASNDEPQPSSNDEKKDDEGVNKESGIDDQERPENSTQDINTAGLSINTASTNVNTSSLNINIVSPTVTTASLEATHADFFGDETEIDISNITTTYLVPSTPNTRIHKDHSLDYVIGDVQSGPKKVIQALKDPRWIEAMQEELLQFQLQQVRTLVDLTYSKRAIGTKWVYRNKKDERGIVIRNKARLVTQGYTQEEEIDYDEVFAPVARIKVIRLFLSYASFKDFVVYQMDVKSAFVYGKIEEEVYACQPPGFEDPEFLDRVYKRGQIDKTLFIKRVKSDILLVQVYVDDIIFGSTKKELCTEFEKLMHKKFQMSSMGELTFFLGLQVTQKDNGTFISQDKYVDEILKKFGFLTVKTASTPMETSKTLMKDENAKDVDVHLDRSMIGSLIYLTSSRHDIKFATCACARFQVTPKVSHLHAVNRIFRYLKGQPKLGLWYPKESPFDLEAYSDSDYASASLDRKSTTGGCQFLGSRLISWQHKKQTIVANSITEAEYVAAASCCGQTKHIEIRHHFIRDSNEKKLIQMIKIHTDQNAEDVLIKSFDVGRFQYLIATANDDMQVSVVGLTFYYALTVNPTIYTSCIKQFWATAKAKTVNGEVQIQALVDGKKVIITETSVRRALHLKDAKGTDYLPTATIFAITAWNESSSTMASAIILFLDKQVEDMSKHKEIYVTPSHTKKIFANIKREGKGFSGRITPLFQTMMVQAPEKVGEGSTVPTDSHHTTTQPSISRPQKKQSRRKQRKDSGPIEPITDEATSGAMVLAFENTNTSQAAEIATLKERVKKLEKKRRSKTYKPRRLYKVSLSRRIESSDDASLGAQEDASKQGKKIANLDADTKVTLIDETQGRNDEDLMFDTGVLNGDEVFQEPMVNTATTTSLILVSYNNP